MQKKHLLEVHPMVIFWLGVLTGAVIVGLVFFYRVLAPANYESSLFKSFYYPYYNYKYSTTDRYSIGTPDGNMPVNYSDVYSIGTPDGN